MSELVTTMVVDNAAAKAGMQEFAQIMERGTKQTTQSIDRLTASFDKFGQEVTRKSTGIGKAISDIQSPLDSLNGLITSFSGKLDAVFTLGGATVLLDQFKRIAEAVAAAVDQMALLRARAVALTGDIKAPMEMLSSMGRLGVDTAGYGQMFSRFAIVKNALGASTEQLIKFTETLINLGRLGGGSVEEVTNAAMQLSQGLASGRLQGDELRSVFEEMPLAAQAIADSLGVDIGTLRKMGEEGKLGPLTVFNAILDSADKMKEKFDKLPVTQEQINSNLSTSVTLLLEQLNKVTGITDAYAKLKITIGQAMDMLRGGLGGEPASSQDLFRKFFGIADPENAVKNMMERIQSASQTSRLPETIYQKLQQRVFDLQELYKNIQSVSSIRTPSAEEMDPWKKRMDDIYARYEDIRKEAEKLGIQLQDLKAPPTLMERLTGTYGTLSEQYARMNKERGGDFQQRERDEVQRTADFIRQQREVRLKQEEANSEKMKGYFKDVANANISEHEKALEKIEEGRRKAMQDLEKDVAVWPKAETLSLEGQKQQAEDLARRAAEINKLSQGAIEEENKRWQEKQNQTVKAFEQQQQAQRDHLKNLEMQKDLESQLLRLKEEYLEKQKSISRESGKTSAIGGMSPDVQNAIDQAATKYGVDRYLMYAVAKRESNFNPNAIAKDRAGNVVPGGGQGLFQFIPSTWRSYGMGRDRMDPYASADAAARLLKELLARTGGDLVAALNRYGGVGQQYGGGSTYATNIIKTRGEYAARGGPGIAGYSAAQQQNDENYRRQTQALIEQAAALLQVSEAQEIYTQEVQKWYAANKGDVMPQNIEQRIRKQANATAQANAETFKHTQLVKLEKEAIRDSAKAEEAYNSIMEQLQATLDQRSRDMEATALRKGMESNIDDLLIKSQIALYKGNTQLSESYKQMAIDQEKAMHMAMAEAEADKELTSAKERLRQANAKPMSAEEESALRAKSTQQAFEALQQQSQIQQKDSKDRLKDELEDSQALYKNYAYQTATMLQSTFENVFFDAMQFKFDNLAANFKQMVDRMVAQALAAQLANALFGESFMAGRGGPERGMGGLLGSLVSGIFGGGGAYGVTGATSYGGGLVETLANGMAGMADVAGGTAGGASESWLSSIGTWLSSLFHEGGIVTKEGKRMHTGGIVGAGWPRMHSGGLAPGEIPVIAQKGEGIFTSGQMQALGLLARGERGGKGITVNLNINNPVDPAGFNRSRKQIINDTVRQIANAKSSL